MWLLLLLSHFSRVRLCATPYVCVIIALLFAIHSGPVKSVATEATRGLQEIRVASREDSGVLGFPSRRGLTPRVLKRQVRWSGIPISFRIFHNLL